MRRALFLTLVLLVACGFTVASDGAATATTTAIAAVATPEPDVSVCPLEDGLEAVKGKPEPPSACCDPALEPGANGNPLCFEGHTCCSDGRWSCNQPDGSPSCNPGVVCEDCASTGDSCAVDADCCSGRCKGGRCR